MQVAALHNNIIWTVGHSTRSFEDFLALLRDFNIQTVVDVRSFPGSRRYPHFNKDTLQPLLATNSIGYDHLPDLGGRRKAVTDSPNSAWRHPAFRGYADHMQTETFKAAFVMLEGLARGVNVAFMCSEGVWWRCHRSLISDLLKARGWTVMHIIQAGKAQEHPYTQPARVVQGNLFYNS